MKRVTRSKSALALLVLLILAGCSLMPRWTKETPSPTVRLVILTSTPEPTSTSAPQAAEEWTAEQAASAAERQLAKRLNVSTDDVRRVAVETELWPDACLGIEIEGRACAQVQTPGYRVLLEADDVIYEYRTDRRGIVHLLGSPGQTIPPTTPVAPPTLTREASAAPAFKLVDKGVERLPSGGTVVKGQVFDRQGRVIANGLAAVGVTVDGVYLQSPEFRNPQPTNVDGWYEIYVRPGQRIGIVKLLLDGKEVPLEGAPMEWVAKEKSWWHVNVRQTEGVFAPTAPGATPEEGEPTETPTRTETGRTARVLPNALNVRRGPGTGYPSIGLAHEGDRLLVLGQDTSGEWLYARLEDGAEGWVKRDFIDFGSAPSETSTPPHATPTGAPVSALWRGEYYGNVDLRGSAALVRQDERIDFDWGSTRPAPELPRDNFSVRWTRTVSFSPGTYRFSVESDDGVRVWIDGELAIDQWHDTVGETYAVEMSLSQGDHPLRVEYYEHLGLAYIDFGWERISDRSS
ncbi:MAG: PA14 domain-containing protein [Chloroflexota bacterium]|nr:PA14 domain-containing protein [Chloroflexota bacterium]